MAILGGQGGVGGAQRAHGGNGGGLGHAPAMAHVHAIDIKEKGGGLSAKIGRAIGTAIVGDSSGWTNKTIIDTLRNVQRQLSPAISYVEGQPAFTGTPWLDPVQLAPSTTDKATQENGAPPAIPTPPAQPK